MADPKVTFRVETKAAKDRVDALRKQVRKLAQEAQQSASDLRKAFSEGMDEGMSGDGIKNATDEMREFSQVQHTIADSSASMSSGLDQASSGWSSYSSSMSGAIDSTQNMSSNITGLDQAQASAQQSSQGMTQEVSKAAGESSKASNEIQGMQFQTTELTKSVQLALGPLSGIAARITAFSAIVKSSTVAVAALVGGIIGLGAAASRARVIAQDLEVTMSIFENRMESMGRTAQFTAEELNTLSIELAGNTLASLDGAREAIGKLTSSTTLMRDEFTRTLELSQDLAATGFGALETQVTRMLRAVEKPGEGIEGLRRAGIMFTAVQEDMIENFMALGDVASARAVILDRVEQSVGGNARAADTLAAALDDVSMNIQIFFEEAADQADMMERLRDIYNEVAGAIQHLTENTDTAATVGEALTRAATAVAHTMNFLANNVREILAAMAVFIGLRGALGVVGVLKGWSAAAGGTRKAMSELVSVMRRTNAASVTSTAALGTLAASVAKLAPVIGLAVAAGYKLWNMARDGKEPTQSAEDSIDSLRGKVHQLRQDMEEGLPAPVLDRQLEAAMEDSREAVDREVSEIMETVDQFQRGLAIGEERLTRAIIAEDAEREQAARNRMAELHGMMTVYMDEIAVLRSREEAARDAAEALRAEAKGEEEHLATVQTLTDNMKALINTHASSIDSYRKSSNALGTLSRSMEYAEEIASRLGDSMTDAEFADLVSDIRMSVALELDDRTDFQRSIDEMQDDIQRRSMEMDLIGLRGDELTEARVEMEALFDAVGRGVFNTLDAAVAQENLTEEQEKWLALLRESASEQDRLNRSQTIQDQIVAQRDAVEALQQEADLLDRTSGQAEHKVAIERALVERRKELNDEGIGGAEAERLLNTRRAMLTTEQALANMRSTSDINRELEQEAEIYNQATEAAKSRFFMSQTQQQAELGLIEMRQQALQRGERLDSDRWRAVEQRYKDNIEAEHQLALAYEKSNISLAVTEELAQGVGQALMDAAEAGKDWEEALGDAITNLLKQIGRMITQMLIARILQEQLFGPSFDGGGSSSGGGSGIEKHANGGVVEFSRGGIPDMGARKQYFPMANGGTGSIRERGRPEAIMPLQRGPDGKLGVRSEGNAGGGDGGGNVYVQVQAEGVSEDQVQTERETINEDEFIRVIINAAAHDVRNRGPLGQAVHSTTGTKPKGRRRG